MVLLHSLISIIHFFIIIIALLFAMYEYFNWILGFNRDLLIDRFMMMI